MAAEQDIGASKSPNAPVLIVGVGASAGGLAAFKRLLSAMPPGSGVALVLVQHLDPTHESALVDLLQRGASVPVVPVAHKMAVEADHVYVIPPNRDLTLHRGYLHLAEPVLDRGLHLPIDTFFRSLAEAQGDRAVGLVLSGTGRDGALGIEAIKRTGGLAMAQDPDTAAYDGMPNSAIDSGVVDYVLPPEEMVATLLEHLDPTGALVNIPEHPMPAEARRLRRALREIFGLLRQRTGHDFSAYKASTVRRRIERRMSLLRMNHLADYVARLRQDPAEATALFQAMLIGVTRFFRDAEAFAVLASHVIPELFANVEPGQSLRVWVPGCATGEEAYSIAILLLEHMPQAPGLVEIQIFATDIDARAIERARAGRYPADIAADVSPERLARYFTPVDGVYQVRQEVRDLLTFAVQNLAQDPPISNLDLVSCRNVLIYMQASLQQRIIPLLQYALKPGGFLFLGSSETLGDWAVQFVTVHRQWKIFQRKQGPPVRPVQSFGISLFGTESLVDLDEAVARHASAPLPQSHVPSHRGAEGGDEPQIERLDRELRDTRAHLQRTVEALRSANEELQAANEELQSTNEELETSQEELRATNDDLIRANEALSYTNADLRNLLDTLQVGIVFLDRALCVRRFNVAATRVIELEDQDVGLSLAEVAARLDVRDLAEDAASVLGSQTPVEHEMSTWDRRWYWVAVHPYRSAAGEVDGVVLTFSDITSRKRAEEARRRSEHQLQAILDNTPAIVYLKDMQGRFVAVNRAFEDAFGVDAESVLGKTDYDLMPQALADTYHANDLRVMSAEQPLQFEEQAQLDGEMSTAISVKFPMLDERGQVYGIGGISTDITERKRIEDALRASEARVTEILESITDAFFALDEDLVVTYFNRAAERLLGREKQDVLGQPLFEAFPEAQGSIFEENYRRALREKRSMSFETYFGIAPYENWYAVNVYPQENGISVYFQVITERKQIEEALRESEYNFRQMVENIEEVFWIRDLETERLIYISPGYERVWGYSVQSAYARDTSFIDAIHPEDRERVRRVYHESLQRSISVRYRIVHPSDGVRWVAVKTFTGVLTGASPRQFGVARDISEQVQAERALRKERDRARQYLEIAGVMIVVLNADGSVQLINRRGCEILGYDRERIEGQNWFDAFIPARDRERIREVFARLMAGDIAPLHSVEGTVVTRDGVERTIAWHNTVLRDSAGRIVGTLSSGEDITERKRAEAQIKTALQEKETLLRELYHRTKNNMQVICAILDLQSKYIEDARALSVLTEVENRIQSMALVHQMLYESENLSSIHLDVYIRNLVNLLMQSYWTVASRVDLTLALEPVSVLIDTAVPCGLVLSELISNALKHAFPDAQGGKIHVRLLETENHEIRFSIADNGVGVPEGFDFRASPTFGLQTVVAIVERQLHGAVTFETEGGVTCRICFRDDLYQPRV